MTVQQVDGSDMTHFLACQVMCESDWKLILSDHLVLKTAGGDNVELKNQNL